MAELRQIDGDEWERELERLVQLGATVELDADEFIVRRALVLDAADVEPGGYVARLAAELGVTADELNAWLTYRHEMAIR